MDEEKQANEPQGSRKGYGQRPLWQWVLIYLVVGGLLYWLVYYFLSADNNGGGLY